MRYHFQARRAELGEDIKLDLLITCDGCYEELSAADKEHRKEWYGKTRDKRVDLCKSCAKSLINYHGHRTI